MSIDHKKLKQLDVGQKRELLKKLLKEQKKEKSEDSSDSEDSSVYESFTRSEGAEHEEMTRFNQWLDELKAEGIYSFEAPRLHSQTTENQVVRGTGEVLDVLNFASYNYLGYGQHPEVIEAAKAALDQYGLGAASTPILSGTFALHQELEQKLLDFYGFEGYGVSLFSSGYGVNTGTIAAYIKPGHHVVLDQASHMSLNEGAKLSQGNIRYFRHNDVQHLETILQEIADEKSRILVCVEGIYSADGDFGKVRELTEVAHRYGAKILVDEAHSMLVAGPNGKGVAEADGVLNDVDMIVITFSKGFCGVGGALIAPREVTQYVNWFAKCRTFSCSLDPAVTGGILKALELGSSPDGDERRKRLTENAHYMRSLLQGKVPIGESQSWIIPIIFRDEKYSAPLNDYLQREGLDISMMQFPATPRNESRIRVFVTSEHTSEQIERAVSILLKAAEKFGFLS